MLSNRFLSLFFLLSSAIHGFVVLDPRRRDQSTLRRFSFALGDSATVSADNSISADKVYFDIQVGDEPIGRLVFQLTNPSPLPLHAENLIKLCRGDRRSIDPAAHYVGCNFEYSPDYIEDTSIMGRYRWGHVLKGRGRNAIGQSDQPLVDPENQLKCTHSCYGGQYYGDLYEEIEGDPGVLLTVAILGPGRGSSRFSIVRVGESPREWKDRLLLNSGVIGKLVGEDSLKTLHAMARQRVGPPKVVACGESE